MNWFKLNPGSDPYLESNYTLTNNPGCMGSTTLCAIRTNIRPNGLPEITENVKIAIDEALNGVITTNVTQLKSA